MLSYVHLQACLLLPHLECSLSHKEYFLPASVHISASKTIQTTEQWKNAFFTLYSVITQLRQEKPSIVIWT